MMRGVPEGTESSGRAGRIYVTGHRNPDTDSIAAAIGYAELKNRQDPGSEYVAVRLGSVNAQTAWALRRSGAESPERMEHVMLRVRDVMREEFPVADHSQPVREVGRTMAAEDLDLVPVVDDDGVLIGVITERALARRYIREARKSHTLRESPTSVAAIVSVLEGEQIEGGDETVAGRVWVHSIDAARSDSKISEGDAVVVGNRPDAQRQSIELGASLIVTSNDVPASEEIRELARERGVCVVTSPLDSYLTSRMISLAAPCEAMIDREPLTVQRDDLLSDVAELVKDVHYRAAVAVDAEGKPVGLITRSDLVSPRPRRVILVDHAEQAQSVVGVEQAEILEILDHHHIGSIETRVPVIATFDPVGSTSTLVTERFRANGYEPTLPTGTMLLAAVLSDTVMLNSPTTTPRDRAVIEYLEALVGTDAQEFGREMFEETSDVSGVPASEIVARDAKEYQLPSGETISIAQIEVVGKPVLKRKPELLDAIGDVLERNDYAVAALMVTDILEQGTELIACGDVATLERAFGRKADDGVISLPGVMSRKKQVAPALLGAF